MFEKQKQQQLQKKDFSRKGSIDDRIKRLVGLINNKKNYYTTSSCSGRIIILTEEKNKKNSKWQFVSHTKINFEEIKENLKVLPNKMLWFRFEPMIIHVVCRDFNDALEIIKKAQKVGFKHSGIIASGKRIVVEIRGTDFISAPLSNNKQLIVDDDYLRILIKEANKKITRNLLRIKKLEKEIKSI
ncbi:MAG: tRNA wybutosine-synthesizing 3 family protein [Candidatus Woesearchaeota archaeon]